MGHGEGMGGMVGREDGFARKSSYKNVWCGNGVVKVGWRVVVVGW